jgi:hypothetical protein
LSKRSIYIISEKNNGTYCKIGKDSNWPFRYKQALSHNPHSLSVNAAWHFPTYSSQQLIELESSAQAGLTKLDGAIVTEWYAVKPQKAVEELTKRFKRQPDESSSPNVPIYNDWGEPNDTKGGITYKSRIWVYSEDVPNGRVKITHGILFDTNFKYNFTYNPRPVYLRCCYEWPVSYGGPSPLLQRDNAIIQSVWDEATRNFGDGPEKHALGWLKQGVCIPDVVSFMVGKGLIPFDLTAPKPADARPKDPSVGAIAIGKLPPLYRYKPYSRESEI